LALAFFRVWAATLIADENLLEQIGLFVFSVPNENYCKFEDWIMPIFDQMLIEQNEQGINWTPSKMIHRLVYIGHIRRRFVLRMQCKRKLPLKGLPFEFTSG
jgi:deoxyhypusine synthase